LPGTTRRTRSSGRTAESGSRKIVFHTERGDLLDILEHPNPERYATQRISVVQDLQTPTVAVNLPYD
jgi:hypothetical protein